MDLPLHLEHRRSADWNHVVKGLVQVWGPRPRDLYGRKSLKAVSTRIATA